MANIKMSTQNTEIETKKHTKKEIDRQTDTQ